MLTWMKKLLSWKKYWILSTQIIKTAQFNWLKTLNEKSIKCKEHISYEIKLHVFKFHIDPSWNFRWLILRLCLTFFICKMGIIVRPTLKNKIAVKITHNNNICKALMITPGKQDNFYNIISKFKWNFSNKDPLSLKIRKKQWI